MQGFSWSLCQEKKAFAGIRVRESQTHHKQEVHKVQGGSIRLWMHFPYAFSSEVGEQEGVLGNPFRIRRKSLILQHSGNSLVTQQV